MVERLQRARTGIPLVLPHALLAFGLLVFAAASERAAPAPDAAVSAAAAPAGTVLTVAALGRN